jgi:hypothetical protein
VHALRFAKKSLLKGVKSEERVADEWQKKK